MKQRIITGLVLLALFLLLLFKGSTSIVLAVVISLATLAYVEFDRLFFRVESASRRFRMALLIALSILAIRQGGVWGWIFLWGSFVFYCVAQILYWRDQSDTESAVRAIALEWLGYTYVVGLCGFLTPIVDLPHGRYFLLLLALIVFGGDTAAYFVGSRFGKHPLAPNISPKKSWEGSIAAIIASILLPCAWYYWVIDFRTESGIPWHLLAIAPAISVLAQVGDLFESLLKRSQSIKDSGSFLPGHGGLLDRVDGLALASPFFYGYLLKFWGTI
ncbi:MAG: phosphatidate cytidylyltransferase [Bdellovibrionaceae bacterium]|nr:phosphatidate cytidylyltransferase [Bdellovibrionales bacterium]MCB9254666.1 phosphatidate cytidylyltransferase [Pseudobdellovibrionaceae bacterium]